MILLFQYAKRDDALLCFVRLVGTGLEYPCGETGKRSQWNEDLFPMKK